MQAIVDWNGDGDDPKGWEIWGSDRDPALWAVVALHIRMEGWLQDTRQAME
jgi:hypothetical protein